MWNRSIVSANESSVSWGTLQARTRQQIQDSRYASTAARSRSKYTSTKDVGAREAFNLSVGGA